VEPDHELRVVLQVEADPVAGLDPVRDQAGGQRLRLRLGLGEAEGRVEEVDRRRVRPRRDALLESLEGGGATSLEARRDTVRIQVRPGPCMAFLQPQFLLRSS
jgi:hypothetical protein